MSGWSGGVANRTWQRGRRSADDVRYGQVGALEDIRAILARFRDAHGWEPGMVWDPYAGAYVRPRQAGQVPPDHPDANAPVGWGEHPRSCDCGDCP